MLTYSLKRRKSKECKTRGLQIQIKASQCFYQDMQGVIAKKLRFINEF